MTNAMEAGQVKDVPVQHHRSVLDVSEFLLRVLAVAATLSAAVVMGRNEQRVTLIGSSTMDAKYSFSPAFRFFVVANAVACAYALLSLVISLLKSMKTRSRWGTKFFLFIFDLLTLVVLAAGASAATAIADVGENGNKHSAWMPICHQFNIFCHHVGGSLVASFLGLFFFVLLTISTTYTFYKHCY